MKYTKLGNTDIEISKLCIGCMSFGKAGTTGATVLDGFEVSGSRADGAAADVQSWIDSLNLEN